MDLKQQIASTFMDLAEGLSTGQFAPKKRIVLTGLGSEHGEENLMRAAELAAQEGLAPIYLGTIAAKEGSGVQSIFADCEADVLAKMESMLAMGEADAAVAMHYPFPIGQCTIGRVVAPATGADYFLASTTGTSATERVEALVRNAIAGLAVAKAAGRKRPRLGFLNLDGARQAEMVLKTLKEQGYDFDFGGSARSDGGSILRGNDLLLGSVDVLVTDTLSGNAFTKMLAAFNAGGRYETVGYGYGPGTGPGMDKLVLIISRASGAALIANAMRYAADLAEGKLIQVYQDELKAAQKAGLEKLMAERREKAQGGPAEAVVEAPPKEVVTAQIQGIDVMDLEDSVKVLWKAKIYAEDGMGCTGPLVRVSEANEAKAKALLIEAGLISD